MNFFWLAFQCWLDIERPDSWEFSPTSREGRVINFWHLLAGDTPQTAPWLPTLKRLAAEQDTDIPF